MYRLEATGIWISGGFFSKLIPYDKVVEIKAVGLREMIFSSLSPFKRPMTSIYRSDITATRCILVETKWARHLVSGDHPDEFVALANERLKQHRAATAK